MAKTTEYLGFQKPFRRSDGNLETRHLFLAVFLNARGSKILSVKSSDPAGPYTFVIEPSEKFAEHFAEYERNGTVRVRDFENSFQAAKRMMHEYKLLRSMPNTDHLAILKGRNL
jgi:hypothetical protein